MKRTTTRGKINSIPRIRDLPKKYQAPFWEHVRDKVRPLIKGIKIKDQDGYYQEQWEEWRNGK